MILNAIATQVSKKPMLRRLRQSKLLNRLLRRTHGSYWGQFRTREDALAFLPPSRQANYDSAEIAQLNIEGFSEVKLFDWPVIHLISDFIRKNHLQTIVDFGGHVGGKYYAYKDVIDLPQHLRWQVVDLPAVCHEGRRRRSEDQRSLAFFDNLADVAGCDVLLCSGALQYANMSLAEVVRNLPKRPRLIIVNKLGVVDRQGYFTLECFGSGRMPYQVFARDQLGTALRRLKFRKLAGWNIPERNFLVHSNSGADLVEMVGEAWEDAQ